MTTLHAARGEVYTAAKRARKALQGPGVVAVYSSGELGIVQENLGVVEHTGIARAQPMVNLPIYMPECA